MFSLIISIVSIALVVALVAATMYHGGDTLTQGRDRAEAAELVSGAQQVSGAASMHLALVGTEPADVAALVTAQYLTSAPAGLTLNPATDTVTATVASEGTCQALRDDASAIYTCGGADAAGLDVGTAPFTFTFSY